MATGDIGYKDTIEYGDGGSPEVFTSVYQVVKIGPGEATVKQVDMTHLESPGRTNESMAGLSEYSEYAVTALYDTGNMTHGQMFTDRANGTSRNWRCRLKDSVSGAVQQTHSFAGYISKIGIGEITTENRRELSFSLKVAGGVTIT